ncbi:MAG TPA: hypothetical protein VJT33_16200 [bacterium]|nr:hypothetical protein [bacterium]
MRRALAAIICIASALAVFPEAARPAAAQTMRPASTDVRLFTPLAGTKLAAGLTAGAPVGGECFAASLASQGRPDAWRCSAGNLILDPCFEAQPPGGALLACSSAPWSPQVRVLKLSKPVPQAQANRDRLSSAQPWALELADGARCTYLTGATTALAGMRLNYGCPGSIDVYGDVDRTHPLWRVFEHRANSPVTRQVDVFVAWF